MTKTHTLDYDKSHISKLDKDIYYLYLFTMPMGRLFYRPEGIPTTLEIMSFSTIVMLVGILLLFRHKNLSYPTSINSFLLLYGFMLVYSLVAGFIISIYIPVFKGVFTILAPLENLVNYFITLLSLLYNYICLSAIKDFRQLSKVFDSSIAIVFFVGILQLGMLNGISICDFLYSCLSIVICLYNPKDLINMERGVTLFGSEPSSVANLFYVIIPYLIVAIRYNWPRKKTHIFMLVLFVILFWGSGSSSVIILLFFTFVCLFILKIKAKLLKVMSLCAFFAGALMAVIYATADFSSQNIDHDSIEYRLYGKVIDRNNGSTQMRSSTIAVNMKLFAQYPLTGVGMGLQGLWYNELTPDWTRKSGEVQNVITKKNVVSNGGGCLFPFWLSSFGFIGIVVMIIFLSKYLAYVRKLKCRPDMYTFYLIGISVAILAMWYVASPKLNEPICFLLAFPLAFHSKKA